MPETHSPLQIAEHRSFEGDDSTAGSAPAGVAVTNGEKTCGELYLLYQDKLLETEPIYSGDYYPAPWQEPDQTRYIDSLVKGLPAQSLCLSYDTGTKKYRVIDGQQRLYAVMRFLSGGSWTLAKGNDIDARIAGQPAAVFADKKNSLNALYRKVASYKLPVTVIECDYRNKSHLGFIFTVFWRFNCGSTRLNNQEMRNCIYSGAFNDLLNELNGDKNWMAINHLKQASDYRYTKQEIILRSFAFLDRYQSYGGRLSLFLNDYMADNRDPSPEFLAEKRKLFQRTAAIVNKLVFPPPMPQQYNISQMEATMTGVAFNLDYLAKRTENEIQKMFEKLLQDAKFSDAKLVEDLSGKERVIARIETAKRIFGGK